jgi:hypothetical protein
MEVDDVVTTGSGYRDAPTTQQETSSVKYSAAAPVQLKEDDPFDLEQYIGQYAGEPERERYRS